jgi:CBS domain containing-hemolysin-like protein
MTTLEVFWNLLAVLALVVANGFFVAAEFALVGADDTRLAGRAEKGDKLARAALAAQKELNYYLSSCQVGITLASLGLGWIGEPAIAGSLESIFAGLPSPLDFVARHTVAVAIAFTVITYLHVVFGEVAPKAVAIFHPEQVARWLVRPLVIFTSIGSPLIWFLNASANNFLRLFGVRLSEGERGHSRSELMLLVKRAQAMGKVELAEQSMISGVFDLTRTVAREVMTPRPDVVAVPEDITLDELIETIERSGHSRLPVYRESLDKVIGIILGKDLLPLDTRGDDAEFDVTKVMREPYFVPDTKPVVSLLAEFRRLKIHIAVVVDEFGGTDGIVTLEDLIEEIVGEIYDEHDIARPLFSTSAGGEPLIDGRAPIDEVNDHLDLALPVEDYDTLGGFILGELGQVPEPGDAVEVADVSFVVERVADRRVRLVRVVGAARESVGTGPSEPDAEG